MHPQRRAKVPLGPLREVVGKNRGWRVCPVFGFRLYAPFGVKCLGSGLALSWNLVHSTRAGHVSGSMSITSP